MQCQPVPFAGEGGYNRKNDMNEQITTQYEGHTIKYIEYLDRWECDVSGDRTLSRISLAEAKKAVDAFNRKEMGFNPVPAILKHWEGFVNVMVTSKADGGWWLKMPDGSRKKEDESSVIKLTDENKAKIQQIIQNDKKIKELQELSTSIKGSLERFSL